MAAPAVSDVSGVATPDLSLVAKLAYTALPVALLTFVLWLATQGPMPFTFGVEWVPALGVQAMFRIDGLSLMMLLLISGIGVGVFTYAGAYMAGDPLQGRLFILLSAFLVSMAGAVTADDLILLFVFWEGTSILSFLLVGLKHDKEASRKSAQQALLVTGTGGLALLAGFLILIHHFGTSQLSAVIAGLSTAEQTPALTIAILLIFVGCFTKSAQVPFHFWLPNAMAAPTPVSAYLHSATMVKLGVFLLARFDAGVGEWPMWLVVLQVVGSLTAAWGMLLALRERDLKRILAWSTVATLGTLVVLVGLPGPSAAFAVGSLLLAHALYKAPLFFVAGNVDHGAGTRIIDNLGYLRRAMPVTAVAAALAGLSMAGVPLSLGFVVKVAMAEAKYNPAALDLVPTANLIFASLAVAVAGMAAVRLFWWNPGGSEAPDAHEGTIGMVLPPLVIASLGVLLGLWPGLVESLVTGVAVAMEGQPLPDAFLLGVREQLDLGLIWTTVGATLVLGALILVFWDFLHRTLMRPFDFVAKIGSLALFEASLKVLPRLAAFQTRTLQHGRAPGYMMLAVTTALAAVMATLPAAWAAGTLPAWDMPSPGLVAGALLVAVGAIGALVLTDRFVMVLAAGLVGYGSALIFVFLGAPDVAFTQFVVETVFVIIASAVLIALRGKGKARMHANGGVVWPLVLAAGLATVITALLVATVGRPFDPALSDYFAAVSVPEAYGRNIVNVILVDFRALDTLGEIAVVALSFIAALPLLQQLSQRPLGAATVPQGRVVMLDVVSGPLYVVILIVSVAILLRGHNEPGGGFIGGLVAASATVLWAVARGGKAAEARMPLGGALPLATWGAGIGALAGVPAWLVGEPFMTHLWATVPLGITELKLSTVLIFDLGVYLCVWGALGGYALMLIDNTAARDGSAAHGVTEDRA